MKLLILLSIAAVCIALSFVWHAPWIGGVGLLVAFVGMFTDRDDVDVRDDDGYETSKTIRDMRRSRDR
ncbi:hypothetical protein BTM25_25100 [Actinomadura rubteroloni]|uniref:Uncharacterized protein n=1 Tax=Actinomadura rubteroloni TaxID=1926885 RepID=A0A2P4UFP3_9ACTN|nr:hypothetical protein [Actinomadura rubteroloni]POM23884.1 hypothetical protein BTM25_25100 [Actinomadura rubteroloni]